MWRSASRRTSRQRRSPNSRTSARLNCAQGRVGLRMQAARDRLDCLAGAGDERIELGEGKRCGRVRDGAHLAPRLLLAAGPGARWLGQIAEREACFGVGPPPHQPRKRPCQESENASRDRPPPYVPALPQPYEAKHQERKPRKRDREDEQRLRPIALQHGAKSHARCSGRMFFSFAWRSPAESPSAKARRTSSVGALIP